MKTPTCFKFKQDHFAEDDFYLCRVSRNITNDVNRLDLNKISEYFVYFMQRDFYSLAFKRNMLLCEFFKSIFQCNLFHMNIPRLWQKNKI